MRNSIGGTLGMRELAMLHRPTDPDTLRVAAVELSRRGLTALDIAGSLGLTETAVRQLLGQHQEAA